MSKSGSPEPSRRLRFSIIVLVSQLLLIALSLAWLVHMLIIAVKGRIYFVENNHLILWLEIILTTLISIFATIVFVMQLRRLGERRNSDTEQRKRLL